jgi:pilus assembly protein Flp/PilA
MKALFNRFVREEKGQDLIEYALLIVFIAIVVALVLPAVGTTIAGVYSGIAGQLGG